MTSIYVNWDGGKIKLTWNASSQVPDESLITSVHGFCFEKDQLMLVHLLKRGWDIPGGHIAFNERAEEAFKREALEEGYVEGKCKYLGYIEISHEENKKWQREGPYPKVGYQLYYRMDINRLHPFTKEFESTKRVFISPKEVTKYHHDWHELLEIILSEALADK